MNSSLKLALRSFPDRIAELGFAANLPTDWISHELPREDVDFSNPTLFVPLAIVTAPHAAIVFAFAARPAYDDGTVHDWAMYHLTHNKIQPRAIGRDGVAGVPAVVGEGTQDSELGTLLVRFAFFEDGNRLVNIWLTAPEILADAVRDAWFGMLQSFKLETPRGSRFGTPQSEPQPPTQPEPEVASAPEVIKESNVEAAPPSPKRTFNDFALEDDTTSLDPETSINANLRASGVGLVPHVVAANSDERRATVAAGAVMAQFDVPYGWYVMDDGKRTLVFEPTGKVQINLNLIPRENRSNDAILDAIESQARTDYPQPEFMRLKDGEIHALGIRNIADQGQPLEQYHMLYPFRDQTMVLRARVTATPDQATDACNLAELILKSFVFDCFQQCDEPTTSTGTTSAKSDGQPEWWNRALALEAQNKLDAAEAVVREGCPYMGFAASIAEMYRLRMVRLMKTGDASGAREAFQRSSNWIFYYASMATSGGEGAALSRERDEFRAQLVADYGSDPKEVTA